MFYSLDSGFDDNSAVVVKYPELDDGISWFSGKRITQEMSLPLEFKLDVDPGVYELYGDELSGDEVLSYYSSVIPLMSTGLIENLRRLGTDNFDTYAARLIHSKTKKVSETHQAVNVIGLVSGANMVESGFQPNSDGLLVDVAFSKLVLDESKISKFKVFRLAENVSPIFVNGNIKKELEKEQHPGLLFKKSTSFVSF